MVIADKSHYAALSEALAGTDTKVYAGEEAVAQVAGGGDTGRGGQRLVGYAGLAPTVAALGAGKKLALANKGVAGGGRRLRDAAGARNGKPRSRSTPGHSAIFQCLVGERAQSGG